MGIIRRIIRKCYYHKEWVKSRMCLKPIHTIVISFLIVLIFLAALGRSITSYILPCIPIIGWVIANRLLLRPIEPCLFIGYGVLLRPEITVGYYKYTNDKELENAFKLSFNNAFGNKVVYKNKRIRIRTHSLYATYVLTEILERHGISDASSIVEKTLKNQPLKKQPLKISCGKYTIKIIKKKKMINRSAFLKYKFNEPDSVMIKALRKHWFYTMVIPGQLFNIPPNN